MPLPRIPSAINRGVRSFSTRIPRLSGDGRDCGCLRTLGCPRMAHGFMGVCGLPRIPSGCRAPVGCFAFSELGCPRMARTSSSPIRPDRPLQTPIERQSQGKLRGICRHPFPPPPLPRSPGESTPLAQCIQRLPLLPGGIPGRGEGSAARRGIWAGLLRDRFCFLDVEVPEKSPAGFLLREIWLSAIFHADSEAFWDGRDYGCLRTLGCPRMAHGLMGVCGFLAGGCPRTPFDCRAPAGRFAFSELGCPGMARTSSTPISARSAFADTHRKTKPEEIAGHLQTPIFSSSPSAFTPESTPLAQCIQRLPLLPGGIPGRGEGSAARRGEMGRATKGSLLFSRR